MRRRAKRSYRSRYRAPRAEAKLTTYTNTSIQDPDLDTGTYIAEIDAVSGGAEQLTNTAQFNQHLVSISNGLTDPYPGHVMFGSRSRVNFDGTLGVPGAGGGFAGVANRACDGSFPIILHPAMYLAGGKNIGYDQYSGRKYATSAVGGKISFFNTQQGNYGTQDLWSGETLFKVYLILQKDCTRTFTLGTHVMYHVNGTLMFKGVNGQRSMEAYDNQINSYKDIDVGKNFTILKKWDLELAASGGDEAFLPFEFYHKFKTPIVTTVDKEDTAAGANRGVNKGCGISIKYNRLQLLFVGRGAVAMTYEIRQYFTDI